MISFWGNCRTKPVLPTSETRAVLLQAVVLGAATTAWNYSAVNQSAQDIIRLIYGQERRLLTWNPTPGFTVAHWKHNGSSPAISSCLAEP